MFHPPHHSYQIDVKKTSMLEQYYFSISAIFFGVSGIVFGLEADLFQLIYRSLI